MRSSRISHTYKSSVPSAVENHRIARIRGVRVHTGAHAPYVYVFRYPYSVHRPAARSKEEGKWLRARQRRRSRDSESPKFVLHRVSRRESGVNTHTHHLGLVEAFSFVCEESCHNHGQAFRPFFRLLILQSSRMSRRFSPRIAPDRFSGFSRRSPRRTRRTSLTADGLCRRPAPFRQAFATPIKFAASTRARLSASSAPRSFSADVSSASRGEDESRLPTVVFRSFRGHNCQSQLPLLRETPRSRGTLRTHPNSPLSARQKKLRRRRGFSNVSRLFATP